MPLLTFPFFIQFSFLRQAMYKKWLCLSRCSAVLIVLQFLSAAYLVLTSSHHFSTSHSNHHCLLGTPPTSLLQLSLILLFFQSIFLYHCRIQMEPHARIYIHHPRLFRCRSPVLHRIRYYQMEVFL